MALYRGATAARLVVLAGGCHRRASLSLRGRFTVGAGAVTATSSTRRTRLMVDVCDRHRPIRVASDR